MPTERKYFTTWGRVQGCCGHLHRNVTSAVDCLKRCGRLAAASGRVHDRRIHRVANRAELTGFDPHVGPGLPLDRDPPIARS
jgi:hypothetical protein